MDLSEEELNYLEDRIPEMTEQATQLAYFATLAEGHSAVIAENGQIIEVFPDGTKNLIKNTGKIHA
jgi:hypothetical protein